MVIVVVYEIDDRNQYPVLLTKDPQRVEHWVYGANLNLSLYETDLPTSEQFLEHPVSVTVVK